MKLIKLAAAATLLVLGTAHAQQATSPLYGELGYTHLDVKQSGFGDASPGLVRAIIGYDVHPVVAVEGMLGFGVREDGTSGTVMGVPFTAEYKVRHAFGVFVKPKFSPTNALELFGRLGYVRTKVRGTVNVMGTTAAATDSEGDVAYGLGLNYRFSPRAHVGVDYMRYYSKDDVKVDGVTISVGMRF